MSKRTAQAHKAIAAAWTKEQELVKAGKGTRDWTLEQQRDILERGKAYDDDGRAFEGHHMKSVKKFPEYQGEAGNIQFLSRPEHLEVHSGDFKNATNGFFDPFTGKTADFGEGKYKSCDIITLSEPLHKPEPAVLAKGSHTEDRAADSPPRGAPPKDNAGHSKPKNPAKTVDPTLKGAIKDTAGKAGKFVIKNRKAIGNAALIVGGAFLATAASKAGKSASKPGVSKGTSSEKSLNTLTSALGDNLEKIQRATPREHMVRGHDRMINGRKVHINPYPRGGKKD